MVVNSRFDQLALHCIPGIGSVTIRQLISHFGSAEHVWNASKKHVLSVRGVGPFTYELLQAREKSYARAKKILDDANKSGTSILFHSDSSFPTRLRHIPDAPSLLFFKGTCNLNANRCLAVVGTRSCTTYGKEQTNKLILELKEFNPLIISGLAYGIDITAHRAALHNNLDTIGVMAGGTDWVYPAMHKSVARSMIAKGGLLSEHPPGTRPDAHNFPARNRIIAGMTDCVLIVEAAETGGALITARLANEYDREVCALPGHVNSTASAGCHKLIKHNQAHLVTSGQDLAYLLNWTDTRKRKVPELPPDLSLVEQRIITVLKDFENGLELDKLSWAANLTIHEAALALINLECQSLIKSLPGNRYLLA